MVELTLAQFAELSLRLERGELRAEVLREAGLTEQQWLEQQMHWLERMAQQLERHRHDLFERYLAVRATAEQSVAGAQSKSEASVRSGATLNLAPNSAGAAATPNASSGFVPVEPPAMYVAPPAYVRPAVQSPPAQSATR